MNRFSNPSRHALLATALLLCLSGCGAIQGAKNLAKAAIFPSVENLKISTQAEALINVDDRGAALPVTLRVYQLSELNQILQTEYQALLARDQEVLGTSLVQRYEFVAYPHSSSVQEFPIKPGTRYIAVLAVMRQTPAPGYYLLDAGRIDGGGLHLRIGAKNMHLTGGPEPLNRGNEGAALQQAQPMSQSAPPAAAPAAPKSKSST